MIGRSIQQPQISAYSEAAGPVEDGRVSRYGNSDFLKAVSGKSAEKAWLVMDDLMNALQVVNRRAYDNVIRKLNSL